MNVLQLITNKWKFGQKLRFRCSIALNTFLVSVVQLIICVNIVYYTEIIILKTVYIQMFLIPHFLIEYTKLVYWLDS